MELQKALRRVFNPTVARYEVATGRPYGHKVQLRDGGPWAGETRGLDEGDATRVAKTGLRCVAG